MGLGGDGLGLPRPGFGENTDRMHHVGRLFRAPRIGCGARYGLSVSTRILSVGTAPAASRSATAFGNVTLPANET